MAIPVKFLLSVAFEAGIRDDSRALPFRVAFGAPVEFKRFLAKEPVRCTQKFGQPGLLGLPSNPGLEILKRLLCLENRRFSLENSLATLFIA